MHRPIAYQQSQGIVMLLATGISLAMLIAIGFTIDIGAQLNSKTELQNAVDMSILAATHQLGINNISDERFDRYVQEFFTGYSIKPNLQITGFYNGNFKDEIHTASVGLVVFL